jgi:phenylpyruvate tautomerase PptA (4-oxalocrotonate tautomerase family)
VCRVPREAVWVVFEEVPPTDWYAAGAPGQPVKR